MSIDRHLAQSIVAGNRHRSTSCTLYCNLRNGHRRAKFTIHCVRQRLSMGNTTSLLLPTLAIDRYLHQSIVADNIRLSIDSSPRLLSSRKPLLCPLPRVWPRQGPCNYTEGTMIVLLINVDSTIITFQNITIKYGIRTRLEIRPAVI